MRAHSVVERFDVLEPSLEAIKIIENVLTYGSSKIMLSARSGSHNFNKYHNTLHELQHVYWAWSCYMNESSSGQKEGPSAQELVMASLFHDHNHSGGRLPDSLNIERATDFLQREWGVKEPVVKLVQVTQFDGKKFPIDPENLAERCMRDADLCSIYTQEGQRLLLGLFEEMSGKSLCDFSDDEMRIAISKSENFLWEHDMYTEHGNRMKDEHLVYALRVFEDYAWRKWEYAVNAFEPTPSQRAAARAANRGGPQIDLPI